MFLHVVLVASVDENRRTACIKIFKSPSPVYLVYTATDYGEYCHVRILSVIRVCDTLRIHEKNLLNIFYQATPSANESQMLMMTPLVYLKTKNIVDHCERGSAKQC